MITVCMLAAVHDRVCASHLSQLYASIKHSVGGLFMYISKVCDSEAGGNRIVFKAAVRNFLG